MADVLIHQRFQDEQAAYEWVEAHLWPNGPVCPRCGRLGPQHQAPGQEHPDRRLQVQGLPQAVHREGRHHLRGQPHSVALMAPGHRPSGCLKKRHQQSPAPRHAGDHPQVCLVYEPSHPRGHAQGRVASSDGRNQKRVVDADETFIGRRQGEKRGMKGIYQHCSEKHLHRYSNRMALGVDDQERATHP